MIAAPMTFTTTSNQGIQDTERPQWRPEYAHKLDKSHGNDLRPHALISGAERVAISDGPFGRAARK